MVDPALKGPSEPEIKDLLPDPDFVIVIDSATLPPSLLTAHSLSWNLQLFFPIYK